MKTAEEFFKEESDKQWMESGSFSGSPSSITRIPLIVYPAIFKVMDEYAAQQVAAERERIKEKLRKDWEPIMEGSAYFEKKLGQLIDSL